MFKLIEVALETLVKATPWKWDDKKLAECQEFIRENPELLIQASDLFFSGLRIYQQRQEQKEMKRQIEKQ